MKSIPANKLFDPESSPVATRKTTDESDDGMRQVFGDSVHDISTISYINPKVHKQASAFASHAHRATISPANTLLLSNAVRVSCFAMQRDL